MSNPRDKYEDSLMLLPVFYESIKPYTKDPETLKVSDLMAHGGPKGKVLAEIFAAEAMNEIDLSFVHEGWKFFHAYLRTGQYDINTQNLLMKNLADTHNHWQKIVGDYKDAGEADKEGFGAPLVLFSNGYMYQMLESIYWLEEYFKKSSVPAIQRKTEREHLKRIVLEIDPEASNLFNPPSP